LASYQPWETRKRKREVKKPPKKKPTAHELQRAAAPVFKKPAEIARRPHPAQ